MSEQPSSNGTLTVIGLGYIGLPTAVVFADNNWNVIGIDVSDRTVEMVNRGELPFVEVGLEEAYQRMINEMRQEYGF